MVDIELVIKMPEEYYKAIMKIPVNQSTADMLIIKNGIPLPKGHGELKDVSKLIYDCDCGVCDKICRCDNCVHYIVREKFIKDAPTIIKADAGRK